jgi:hypothetical protein
MLKNALTCGFVIRATGLLWLSNFATGVASNGDGRDPSGWLTPSSPDIEWHPVAHAGGKTIVSSKYTVKFGCE